MKKFTKLASLSTLAALGLMLGACGNDNNNNDNDTSANEGNGATTQETDGEPIVIRYANWNLGTEEENNLERRMIAAFEDAHPNITIEIDESIPGGDWMENLSIAASTGDLPDVFMISDTGASVANQWLLDITDIANADSEFTNLPDSIRNSTMINDSVYTVPFAQFMMGFFVNRDLFNDLNLDAPEFGFTMDEFLDAVRATTDLNRPTIGVNQLNEMVTFFPGAVNPDMGFFTFDGENFHLDSDEMREAVRVASELSTNGFVHDSLTDEQREVFSSAGDVDVFRDGQLALLFDGSWLNGELSRTADFDWDFIGVPGGRPVLTLDILGIAQTTEHPEAAYKFARWMGFGAEGYLTRLALAEEMGQEIASLPVTTDADVLAAYWEMVDVPGLIAAYENLDNALVDGNKVLPGWGEARFSAPTGMQIEDNDNATIGDFLWHSVRGNVNFADYATRLNELAQDAFDRAVEALQR